MPFTSPAACPISGNPLVKHHQGQWRGRGGARRLESSLRPLGASVFFQRAWARAGGRDFVCRAMLREPQCLDDCEKIEACLMALSWRKTMSRMLVSALAPVTPKSSLRKRCGGFSSAAAGTHYLGEM